MTTKVALAALFTRLIALAYGEQQPTPIGQYEDDLTALRQQAEQGNIRAQATLGAVYDKRENYAEALLWYRKAAEHGDDRAQYLLGGMYDQGKGVAQDYAEAVRWWRRAADPGNEEAPFNLGVMYALGRGVAQDNVQAYMWASIALRVGRKSGKAASSLREVLAAEMSTSRVAEAQRMANQWKPKNGVGEREGSRR
jgi:uncharacterized protein